MVLWKVITAIACGFAVLALVVAGVALREITSTRDSLSQAQAQLRKAQATLSQVNARADGSHRDLITCEDLQNLINDGVVGSYFIDNSGNLQSTPASLPTHCINP